jgi:N-methylhydantoinase A
MSWSAGLSIGSSFAEFTAYEGSIKSRGSVQRRWYLAKLSLSDGLKAIFAQDLTLQDVDLTVTLQSADWLLERRRGGPIAWIGTMGFESWPGLMTPELMMNRVARPAPLVDSDFMMGLSERTLATGQIERQVTNEDLEFLVAKLEMAKVKEVAVGFLHSLQNPQNEKTVCEFLGARGFSVYPSHLHTDCRREVERWRLAMLDAYVAHEVVELENQLAKIHSDLPAIRKINFKKGKSTYLTQFELARGLVEAPAKSLILNLGIEQFAIFETQSQMTAWPTEFGAIYEDLPRFRRLQIQPTQTIARDHWECPGYTVRQSGYEPGPMILGKSLVPTFIDILCLIYGVAKLTALDGLISDKAEKRILEALFTEAKRQFKSQDVDAKQVAHALEDFALQQIVHDICTFSDRRKIICCGAFAEVLLPTLRQRLPDYKWVRGSEFVESETLAQQSGRGAERVALC